MIWDWQILPIRINEKIIKLRIVIFQSELAIILTLLRSFPRVKIEQLKDCRKNFFKKKIQKLVTRFQGVVVLLIK